MDPKTYEVAFRSMKDLQRFPELVWLDRWNFVPPMLCFLGLWALGEGWQLVMPDSPVDGMMLLMWGGVIRVVAVWHVTWSVNSLCHVWGSRSFDTTDDSRNNLLIALLACGEGWHNNHHHDPSSARSGLSWSQPDISYAVIRAFEILGLIWEPRVSRARRAR